MKTKLQRVMCALFALMVCASVNATVYNGNCGASNDNEPTDAVQWSFDTNTGTLTFTGTGKMFEGARPWQQSDWTKQSGDGYFTTLKKVIVGEGITNIPASYFYMESKLEQVVLFSSVTSIGIDAFGECKKLAAVYSLATVPLTLGDKGMETSVFYDNDETDPENPKQVPIATLADIYVPEAAIASYQGAAGWSSYASAVKAVTMTTFTYTGNAKIPRFEEVEYFVGAAAVYSHTFDKPTEAPGHGEVVYVGKVTELGSNCLQFKNDLYSIVIPEGVEKLGFKAFYACQKLTDIALPLSLKEIGDVSGLTFEACTDLEKGHFVIKDLKWWCSMVIKGIYSNPIYYAKHIYDTNNQEITDLVIPEDITSIGDYAFCRCEGLKSVTFHDKMTYLGANSFYSCTGLTNVEIPASIKTINEGAFMRCSNLASVTIPEGIETIGFDAFTYSGLKTLTLPSTIRDMMQSFVSCEQLETLTLTDGITELDGSFYYCHALKEVRIPGSIKKLSFQDFMSCNSLETVVFDEGVEEIAGFTDNPKLKNITIPSTVKKIGSLRNNPSLETIFIPEGVEYLAKFDDCTALKQINIPSTITYIGSFKNCNALEKVIVADLKSWCHARHSDGWYPPQQPSGTLYLGTIEQNEPITKLEIPEGTERVEAWAFEYLTSLTSVSIPSSVKILGGGTFYGCTNIEEIVLPEGLEQFGYKEFAGCTKLAKLTIPSTVIKIDQDAFVDVSALENIWCKAYPNKLYWRDYAFNTFMPEKATKFHVVNQTAWEEKYPEAKCTFVGDIEVESSTLTYNANAKIDTFDDFTKFNGAYDLISHEFADGKGTVKYVGTVAGIGEQAFRNNTELTSVEIPEGSTSIDMYAFDGCTGLTTMTIPASVTSIGRNAFSGCTGLTTLTIEEPAANASRRTAAETGLQHIGNSAFAGCTGVTTLNLPATVNQIENGAFWGMSNLADVYCKADPTNLEWQGYDDYEQFMAEKATKMHVVKCSAWEAKFPNANVTFVNDNEVAFNDYKDTKKADCDALLLEGDDEVCQQLVTTAKADIEALAFDEDKSLEDNKTAIDAIVTKLAADLENHRKAVGISEISVVETARGNAYNLSGQRVNNGYKGITIVNGKKVVSKK